MNIVLFSIGTIAPTFLIILLGAFIRRIGILDTETAGKMSSLVFRLLLPALLIRTLANMDKESDFTPEIALGVLAFYVGTIALTGLVSWLMGTDKRERGYFMTGASSGNNAIIGYAFGAALYGSDGLARAALLSAILMPLTILSSGVLLSSGDRAKGTGESIRELLLSLMKNPVMIALIVGILLWRSPATLPGVLNETLAILGSAALPVALLGVGGSLSFHIGGKDRLEIGVTALMKLFVMPGIAMAAAAVLRLSPAMTGSLLLMAACPSSISYYVMARNMGHDPAKGAAVVTVTTLFSAATAALIAGFLRAQGWV